MFLVAPELETIASGIGPHTEPRLRYEDGSGIDGDILVLEHHASPPRFFNRQGRKGDPKNLNKVQDGLYVSSTRNM
jgi:hypothetical protein